MTNYEYARIHLFMLLPNGAGSENVDQNTEPSSNQNWTLLPPWIRINETNMVHVSNCRNLMAFIFHIEYMQFAKTVSWNIGGWKSETQNIDVNILGGL